MTELQVIRKWNTDLALLEAVRGLYSYGLNDDRATGIIYGEGRKWPESFATFGPLLLTALKFKFGIDYEIVAFQAYMDGSGCGWHQDTPFDAQAVLSLGVTRTFGVKPLSGEPTYVKLNHGDLVVMPSGFQKLWQHCVPVEDIKGERCSLVFRTVLKS